MIEYYVTITAYDTENDVRATHTFEPSEYGILRLAFEMKEKWAEVEKRLQRKGQRCHEEIEASARRLVK